MITTIYDEVLNQVQRLSYKDQLRLLADLATLIRRQAEKQPEHDVREFRGFAKELWKGVDVEKYIDEERNSWDG